ncbi:MAG: hypothetical protein IIA40_07720 [SAR324 cluster bacterium]|nr:hypothetical protein [SAR324 cluster bacterium]
MNLDSHGKYPMAVEPFRVKVLGGSFHVSEVLLMGEESSQDVIAIIDATPEDRWFVMVSDSSSDERDSLTMVDDNLEFQIYAHGVLRQE